MLLDVNGLRLTGRRFGVGRYIEYLLTSWTEVVSPFEGVRVLTPSAIPDPFPLPPSVDHQVLPTRMPNSWWEQVVLPRAHIRSDLLFCPSYVVPLATRGRVVVTHLGSYEALPSAFPLHERVKTRVLYERSAKRADLVITVSESSKADILRFYGVPEHNVEVIPLGVDRSFRPLAHLDRDSVRRRYFADARPLILFVGKLTRRRNIPELVAAFARLRHDRELPHGLVLVGEDTTKQDVPRLAAEHGVADAVVHRAYESHDSLLELYNASDLFVYPSSYEGFGIPVLEAMGCGTPAVTLRNSAFVEFADGAYLCENGSIGELYRGMDTVLSSEEIRHRLREAGVARSRDFYWDDIARRTMETLASVARGER
jgi:glycosyltransferase involved in cell wall biosynthesis